MKNNDSDIFINAKKYALIILVCTALSMTVLMAILRAFDFRNAVSGPYLPLAGLALFSATAFFTFKASRYNVMFDRATGILLSLMSCTIIAFVPILFLTSYEALKTAFVAVLILLDILLCVFSGAERKTKLIISCTALAAVISVIAFSASDVNFRANYFLVTKSSISSYTGVNDFANSGVKISLTDEDFNYFRDTASSIYSNQSLAIESMEDLKLLSDHMNVSDKESKEKIIKMISGGEINKDYFTENSIFICFFKIKNSECRAVIDKITAANGMTEVDRTIYENAKNGKEAFIIAEIRTDKENAGRLTNGSGLTDGDGDIIAGTINVKGLPN